MQRLFSVLLILQRLKVLVKQKPLIWRVFFLSYFQISRAFEILICNFCHPLINLVQTSLRFLVKKVQIQLVLCVEVKRKELFLTFPSVIFQWIIILLCQLEGTLCVAQFQVICGQLVVSVVTNYQFVWHLYKPWLEVLNDKSIRFCPHNQSVKD